MTGKFLKRFRSLANLRLHFCSGVCHEKWLFRLTQNLKSFKIPTNDKNLLDFVISQCRLNFYLTLCTYFYDKKLRFLTGIKLQAHVSCEKETIMRRTHWKTPVLGVLKYYFNLKHCFTLKKLKIPKLSRLSRILNFLLALNPSFLRSICVGLKLQRVRQIKS